MSTEPNDVATLLHRWKAGEDVADAMAHKLRHYASGCATLRAQRDDLQIVADYGAELALAARAVILRKWDNEKIGLDNLANALSRYVAATQRTQIDAARAASEPKP